MHIETIGSEEPSIALLIYDIRAVIGEIDGEPVQVEVFFTRQQRLTTTELLINEFEGFSVSDRPTTTVPAGSAIGGPQPTSAGG